MEHFITHSHSGDCLMVWVFLNITNVSKMKTSLPTGTVMGQQVWAADLEYPVFNL
jgi:hypothetical protein